MSKFRVFCLKVVRWTGWLMVPVMLAFYLTGYAMSGRYGLAALTDEQSALTLHRLMHLPLGILLLAHIVPAFYLATIRWGWIKTNTNS